MLDIQFFRTPFATVTKAYRGDSGQMYIEGVASSTNLDQTKEKMSPEAIKIMAAGFTGKPLNSEHKNDWDDELGKIIQSDVIEKDGKPALWIKARLNDWMGRARDLFTGLNDGHLSLGLSVEGKINPGGLVKEFDQALGQYVPVYKDIAPAAVAITNKPANLDTFVDAVTKSIKIEDLPEGKNGGSYIIIKRVVDGVPSEDTICKDTICKHDKCFNKTCLNKCEKCVDVRKDTTVPTGDNDPNQQPDNIKNPTLDCGHPICSHGQCLERGCKNMCKICMTAKVDMAAAGPVPGTLLARQDLEGHSHDYCQHGKCFVRDCPEECPMCSDHSMDIDKDVANAHETKPTKYKDVPEDKFLDLENHKYPADTHHLPAALSYFNHSQQRTAGGYAPDKWAAMGQKLASLLGGGYQYDASSEKVVQGDDGANKSTMEGGDINNMEQHNQGVLQKQPYSQEVLDIIKAWGGNNPGNQELLAKATASVGSQNVFTTQAQPQATAQQQATGEAQQQAIQKGSSSSDSSTSSSSYPSSSSSDSSHESLSSLLSSVLTTLSDMKSSVSGSSPSSSSDSSTDSSTNTSDKTSTDKNFSGVSTKTSTDKAMDDTTEIGSGDSYDEATKALSLALANFHNALEKGKKQQPTGKFAENGTQHAGAAKEGKDTVNGPAQEPDEQKEPHRKVSMPKGDTASSDNVNGSAQEPDYNSMASKSAPVNQDKFVKSIDTMITLMQKIGEKVETVEGKVDAMPNVRKGIAIDKQFTEEERAEFAKNEANKKNMEAKLLADPKVGFKEIHQFRTYGTLPAGYQQV